MDMIRMARVAAPRASAPSRVQMVLRNSASPITPDMFDAVTG
ncbi:hypothetical protein [Rhodovulum sp. 12E13]|nr:hypothetical protein [Rhodovulum sp. 12E13]